MASRDYFDAYGLDPENMTDAQRDAFGSLIADLESAQSRYSLKVSDKGAISIYGVGRFPLSLYPNQIAAVLEMADRIKRFAQVNRDEIQSKTGREIPASLLR